MKTIKIIQWAFLFVIILTSCSVHKATTALDSEAKTLVVPNDKALVYVVRPSVYGGAIRFTTNCDNEYIGSTAGQMYVYTIQDPGLHKFSTLAENTSELEVNLEPNRVYFIEQKAKMGVWSARNRIKLLNNDEGFEKLKRCNLSKDCAELDGMKTASSSASGK